jgi:hypothetical protein
MASMTTTLRRPMPSTAPAALATRLKERHNELVRAARAELVTFVLLDCVYPAVKVEPETGAGVAVNVTLLFSDTHHLRTADAYLQALERRRRSGLDLAMPLSGLAVHLPLDTAADPMLPPALHGKLGLAMAQKTYASGASEGASSDSAAQYVTARPTQSAHKVHSGA